MLGVVQQDETFDNLPGGIRAVWRAKGDDAMWATDLYGDYRVCALTATRPGRMQMVVVTSGSRLVGRPREQDASVARRSARYADHAVSIRIHPVLEKLAIFTIMVNSEAIYLWTRPRA
jgi:hypothetical protein